MKKILVALLMVVLLFSLCACGVNSNSFMSRSQVNSLSKEFSGVQAVLTLTYESNGKTIDMKVTYDLLLDQAPIAVTRFIQIANDGGYDGTRVDTYNSTYKYVVMGRYGQKDDSDGKKKYYDFRSHDVTFAGEFKQNGYRAPKGGYAEFELYSLAMYHVNEGEEFNSANGAFILDLSGEDSGLNSANYAVFAKFASMTILTDGEVTTQPTTSKRPQLSDKLVRLTSTTSRTVYDAHGENPTSIKIASNEVTVTVEILGDYDWSKLPIIR
ncbi:MAG: peptidylprolyl isomerase [Clostridiales bacterium]|nr:peptidylprolyl isomerase [Clostridiales bacterium]